MPKAEVERGPCKVASKQCEGKVPSKNSKWRTATKAGELNARDPRCGDACSKWSVGDDVCGPCKGLALAPKAAAATTAAAAPAAAAPNAAVGEKEVESEDE